LRTSPKSDTRSLSEWKRKSDLTCREGWQGFYSGRERIDRLELR